ncbi:MAG: trypsin-like peptidase domain-containing protein [Thermogutta sp.]
MLATRPFRLTAWAGALFAIYATFAAGYTLSADNPRETPIVIAIRNARPAVVNIRGEKTLITTAGTSSRSEPARRVNGMGTGVIIDERGYIVTNHHVVDGVRDIEVTLYDGTRYTARLLARDPETDLAIIKIDPDRPLQVIKIGTSSDLMPGESVIALGNAYGYEHTATRGIVSALHRAVQVSDAQYYDDLIQTDASINPGNSGGPLLNINGEMIGVNVAVRAGAQGIGFAIPVDRVVEAAARLLAEINSERIRYGITFQSLPPTGPLTVASVEPDSPAAKAGLLPGDVITEVNGQKVANPLDFQRILLDKSPGTSLNLVVLRNHTTEDQLALTLAEPKNAAPVDEIWSLIGLRLEPIPPERFRQQFQTHYRGGLLITDVRPGSPAASQGLRKGDVLVGMHLWETISVENVLYIIRRPDFASFLPLKFFILRGNETYYGYFSIAMRAENR